MGSLPYNRPKASLTNSTPIVIVPYAKEKPEAPIASGDLAASSNGTGAVDVFMMADANETGGADVQPLFRIEGTPVLSDDGTIVFNVVIKAIGGADSLGASYVALKEVQLSHPQDMDEWQLAAGRSRQA